MRTALILIAALMLAACGGDLDSAADGSASGAAVPGGLTEHQLEHGIGPVESVSLGALDESLAESGEEIFETKCSACHKMSDRYVGPALGGVLARRTPEYVMNMILNPEEMLQKHPEAKAMLAQFMTPMPNQQLTREDARAVVEYLREEGSESE